MKFQRPRAWGSLGRCRPLSAQEQLLHPPIRSLADVQLTLRGARERVRTGELSQVASRATDHPQHGAIEGNLEDSSRVGRFPHEEHLHGPGCNAERIGCADRLLETFAGGCRTVDRAGRGIGWHIDREHALEVAVGVEHLDAMVRAIADVDVVSLVDGNRVRDVELAGPVPFDPHDFTQSPFLSYLATRELIYPSVMYVLPCESQATSVG